MFKSSALFTVVLGGIVLTGCNKDEPAPTPPPAPTAPTPTPTTGPSVNLTPPTMPSITPPALPTITPPSIPTTLPGSGAGTGTGGDVTTGLGKVGDALGGAAKSTTNPSDSTNK